MGFDVAMIVGHVDEELFCPICTDVLEDPRQSSTCEHAFCHDCIEKWMQEKQICPVDRSDLLPIHLVPVSRLMRNMLGRLKIRCCFAQSGCSALLPLGEYRCHVANCLQNPNLVVVCPKDCGLEALSVDLSKHSCLVELLKMLRKQNDNIASLKAACEQQARTLTMIRDRYEVMRWGHGLPMVSIRNWSSLVSFPDAAVNGMVREGLRNTGCPLHLIDFMMHWFKEESWPQGMNTAETRRNNMLNLRRFVARLLPIAHHKCVVILGTDNGHMPENLRPSLCIVMVFTDNIIESLAVLPAAPPPSPLPDNFP